MTEQELRDQLRKLLARRPYVPVRVEGMNGNAVYIDNPYGIEFQNGTLTIHQKLDGPRKVPVSPSQIRQLTPLDELPGENGGMSYRDFIATVRPFLRAGSFRVFVVELLDGTALHVSRPGQLLLCSRVGSYEPEDRAGTVVFRVADVRRVLAHLDAEVAAR
jgi:hypothetical protein